MHNMLKTLPYFDQIEDNIDFYEKTTSVTMDINEQKLERFRDVVRGTHIHLDTVNNLATTLCGVSFFFTCGVACWPMTGASPNLHLFGERLKV